MLLLFLNIPKIRTHKIYIHCAMMIHRTRTNTQAHHTFCIHNTDTMRTDPTSIIFDLHFDFGANRANSLNIEMYICAGHFGKQVSF